ncbi:MAG: XRE family transcriptional regulator [Duodenibacillus sp.]
MSSFGLRLKSLLKHAGMNYTELAERLGVCRQSVAYWASGRNMPSRATSEKIAEMFGVSLIWLRTGNDETGVERVAVSEDAKHADDYVFIPEFELSFGCSPTGIDGTDLVEQSSLAAAYRLSFFQSRRINPAKCRRARAEGDSMEPLIRDGDTVLFVEEPQGTPIRDGRIYALLHVGSLKIKRLSRRANGDLVIRSDNREYPDEVVKNDEIDELIRIFGPVIERSGPI